MTDKKKLLLEVILAWVLVIGLSRLSDFATFIPFIAENPSLITAMLLLYVPLTIYWMKKERLPFLDTTAKDYLRSLRVILLFSAVIFPLVFAGNHFYQSFLGNDYHPGRFPKWGEPQWGEYVFFQILVVALPEEFFFRGYFQERMNRFFTKHRQILGAAVGWGLPVTSLIFALSHSLIQLQWWHIFIFFPSMAFGWLKEKTGSITAGVLFHAACNVFSRWVFIHYS